ncbi:STAS domain-containing protein [Actinacidiphila sp. ITFR-21]|uniref:STAS domain-containing protein n=1 Tax=Actinacidiphila sp. ITFR-21 TaxID=3075199 RepID=UPI00288A34FA|nr:STAS domain-containing protein [Streptomyces sp. ITFR-21]WNI14146.1 STAS domain-containing protein [Streptomyces sp. ITFR-21]
MTAPALQVTAERAAARVTLVLVGELDLDGAQPLRTALAEGFSRRPQQLVLDLWDLRFCDCAGLNVLLEAEAAARQSGVELRLEGVRAQLTRLFGLAGVDDLLSHTGQRLPPRIL